MGPPISARMTILALLQVANASVNGAFEDLPSSFICWNIGDSFKRSRIQTDTPNRMTETKKGMRQPQTAKSASPIAVRVNRITSNDRNRPSVAVVWMNEV